MRAWLGIMFAALLVSSCQSDSPVDFAPMTFTRYHPIFMDVSSIEIVEEYKSPLRPPYVEHLLPYSPAEAVNIWVRDRLRAIGLEKTMQVIIREGSVKSTLLHKDNSIEDFLTIDQDYKYDTKLEVELRIYGSGAMSEASVSVKADKSITISENASVYRRNALFRQMIRELMEKVNAELEKNIYMHLSGYINYSQNP